MSERWFQVSKKILDQIEKLEKSENKDRLEHVRSIRFVLSALQRSLLGWTQWVSNPDVMARFTREELEEMDKKLAEFTRSFIEYDMEVTKKGEEKGLEARRRVERREREGGVYIF